MRHAYAMLFFGLTMLGHAEETDLSLDPEFAWTFPEFPLAIKATTQTVESIAAFAKEVKT